MPGLKRAQPFSRKGRQLPGQSSDEDLGVDIRIIEKPTGAIINEEFLQIGNVGAGRYVEVSASGVRLYTNSALHIDMQSDGDLFIGKDTGVAADTYISIFAQGQTYNGESFSAGDMLIGDNSASKANIFWDKSTGRLNFRGGQTTMAYIDTDGSVKAGSGDVILDSDGLTVLSGTGGTNQIKIDDGSDTIFKLYTQVDSQTSQLQLFSIGKNASNHEASVEIFCQTDDGAAHAGTGQTKIMLETANDQIRLQAEQIRGFKAINLTTITTTERDALPAQNGMIIYNSTTSKFQGRAAGSWVDLH